MENKKRSFFERLTGSTSADEETVDTRRDSMARGVKVNSKDEKEANWIEEENEEAELSVDVYQTPTDIIVQTMVAGVRARRFGNFCFSRCSDYPRRTRGVSND